MTNNKPSIKIGDTFKSSQGELCVVVNYISCSRILIRFSGSSSFERYVRADHLRSGSFNNPFYRSVCGVGFLGVGEHKTRQSNKKAVTKAGDFIIGLSYDISLERYSCSAIEHDGIRYNNLCRWDKWGKSLDCDISDLLMGSVHEGVRLI